MTFAELGIKEKPGQSQYSTICPNCDGTRQKHKGALCLTVYDLPGNQHFKCFHCGWSGNLDIMDKFKAVQDNSKMPKNAGEIKGYTKEVREYYERRGISQNILLKEKIYEFTMGGNPIIGYPIYMNLTLVNVKYFNVRWTPDSGEPKHWQMKREFGSLAIFMGLQSLEIDKDPKRKTPNTLAITEGEADMLTWKECGINNSITVPQGAPNPNSKEFKKEFEYLEDPYVKSVFKDIDLIYLSTDNDDPGIFLRDHLALHFGKDRCRIIQYPDGYKDINEVLVGKKNADGTEKVKGLGKDAVLECMKNASPYPIKGIVKPSDVRADLNKIAKDGFVAGLGIGIPEIDKLFTLKPKLFVPVTGVPMCFAGDQLIHTDQGATPISEIKEGDMVITYNHKQRFNEFKPVLKTHKIKERKDRLFKITLKDGTIIKVTEDHLFFTGVRYEKIKDILLSLDKIKK